MSDSHPISDELRTILRGFPEETVRDCAEFKGTGDRAAFDRALLGLLHHHLSPKPPRPLSTYPGTTPLVAELGLDSITMVELVFIFEDLFQVKLPQEELVKVVTIDDLRALLQRALPGTPA
ncbi:MAG: acyl carrier protein [Opitutaceae bacterium]|nr:acyl carrier protein [Opitutaceae bacterium]